MFPHSLDLKGYSMKCRFNAIALFILLMSGHSNATTLEQEIQYLLSVVKKTDCLYERNGTKHKGEEAVKHIIKKYDYFKDDIKTAEDFIRLSATKSTMSGKTYQVHCPNKATQDSAAWLKQYLKNFRQNK